MPDKDMTNQGEATVNQSLFPDVVRTGYQIRGTKWCRFILPGVR